MKHGRRRKTRSVRGQVAALFLGFVLLLALFYQGGRWLEARMAKPEARGDHLLRRTLGAQLEREGTSYKRKDNLTAILFAVVEESQNAGMREATLLRLLLIDHSAQTLAQLRIDCDAMTVITGANGTAGEEVAQIRLACGRGDEEEQRCEHLLQATSRLLMGSTIDFYAVVNSEDLSALGMDLSTEDLEASIERLDDGTMGGQAGLAALYSVLEPHILTNLSQGQLINEVWAARDYERGEALELPGTEQMDEYRVRRFYVDEDSLEPIILELFYDKLD